MSRGISRWPLRRSLVAGTVSLLAVVGIVIGTVSVLAVQSFMINRVDEQLAAAVLRSVVYVTSSDSGEAPRPVVPSAPDFLRNPGNPPGTLGVVIIDGQPVYAGWIRGNAPEPLQSPKLDLLAQTWPNDAPITVDLGGGVGEYRVMAAEVLDGSTLVVGLPLGDVQTTIRELIATVALVTALGVILAAVAAYAFVRVALRPLDRVAGTAATVSEMQLDRGDVALSVRVPDEDTGDRTEVGRVGASLNRMLGHIAQALTARQASENKVRTFVSDASHELRTPLASIRGYAELTRLSGETLPPDARHALTRIESEAKRMTSIVEELLLLARLDEGRELAKDPVDLVALVRDAVDDARAASADHEWLFEQDAETIPVTGDSARLYQVVSNLLANARVHTPPGTRVRAAVSADDTWAAITVRDNGPGIEPSIVDTVFERFVRGDVSRTRATGSTGLGLAIVEAVVDAHGGRVSVASEPGFTEFTILLPVPGPAPAATPPTSG